MRPPLPLLLLLLVVTSCSDSYLDGVLFCAESLMEAHPDSSLAVLRRLDRTGIATPGRKARYALDYAMALDKNWVDTTDVTVIEPALKHYRWSPRRKERFLSRYYYARILENGQSPREALQTFTEAKQCFGKGVDSVYLIRIHAAMGRIYAKQFIDDKAEAALQEAVRLAREQKDMEDEQRMMLSLADFYGATERFEQKDSILVQMGKPLPGLEQWKARSVAYLVFLAPADSILFRDDWSLFCQTANQHPELLDKNSLVMYLLFRQKHTEALSVLSRERPDNLPLSEEIAHWGQMVDAYKGLGDYEGAFNARNRYSTLVEKLSSLQARSDLRATEERYEARVDRYRNIMRCIVLSLIILFLSVAVVLLIIRRRDNLHRLEELREEYGMLVQLRDTELARHAFFAKKLENRLTALRPFLAGEFPNHMYDSAELRRMTEDTKEMLRNVGFLFGIYHPKFVCALEGKGLSELELGYCCFYALGFNGVTITDPVKRGTLYHTNSAIRRKIGLGPHDTNLSIWIQNLYGECEEI